MNQYRLIQDNDDHWYIIPWGFEYEFERWVDAQESGDMDDDYYNLPDFVKEIDGPHRLIINNYTVL